jgi:hypothetical protein
MLSPGNFSFCSVQASKDSDIHLVLRKFSPEVVGSISVRRNYFLNHFLKKQRIGPNNNNNNNNKQCLSCW